MSIQMIGIDHSLAGVEVREKFSFTGRQTAALMEKWKRYREISGIVLLSTCNRTEIYINSKQEIQDFYKLLCEEKEVEGAAYRPFFCIRKGREAVSHLFEMTAGLHSLIVGEDQILTQVKDALSFAREEYAVDKVLEVLFRQAITAAKEMKTKVSFSGWNLSTASEAVQSLKRQGRMFKEKKCLVIGNGVMGRLTAQTLLNEGADVTVTVRQYHRGIVDIPAGAARIDYGRRYEILPECDYIFSATASPNLTIKREKLELCKREKEQIFVDLAVPRDMEPAIKEIPLVILYDVDDFALQNTSPQMERERAKASELIGKRVEEFESWYECRELIPLIQKISHLAALDLCGRLEKPFRQMEASRRDTLLEAVENSADKVAARMLFALRDGLDTDSFRDCLEVLERKMERE